MAAEADAGAASPAARTGDGSFTVVVKPLADKRYDIPNCRDTTTVKELKERIRAVDGTALDTQKFVFSRDGTKMLTILRSKADDTRTLADVGLPLSKGRDVLLQLQAPGAGEKKTAIKKPPPRNSDGDDAHGAAIAAGAAGGNGDAKGDGAAAAPKKKGICVVM